MGVRSCSLVGVTSGDSEWTLIEKIVGILCELVCGRCV